MVKLLNKLASVNVSGVGGGSKVLTDLVEGLQEQGFAIGLRLKIDQNHGDLKGGSFRDYGEAVIKHLENTVDLDKKLQKAPVNYEGNFVLMVGSSRVRVKIGKRRRYLTIEVAKIRFMLNLMPWKSVGFLKTLLTQFLSILE